MTKKEKHITRINLEDKTFNIDKKTRFLDNGNEIKLILKQSDKFHTTLILNDESIEHLRFYYQITHSKHEFINKNFRVFSIVHPDEMFYVIGYKNKSEIEKKEGNLLGSSGYYENALFLKESKKSMFFSVKVFDSELEEVIH